MRKFVEMVTVTGADENTSPAGIREVAKKYPFLEWGVLASPHTLGKPVRDKISKPRFPREHWIRDLVLTLDGVKLSLHLCGGWARATCSGNMEWTRQFPYLDHFQRIQLNVSPYLSDIAPPCLIRGIGFLEGNWHHKKHEREIILQLRNTSHTLLAQAQEAGANIVGFFDVSGGRGLLPHVWPASKGYTGYGGGLSPKNVAEHLERLSVVCQTTIWIDAETHLRTDGEFDLEKVAAFAEAAKPYVIQPQE